MKRDIFKKYPHLWMSLFFVLAASLSVFCIQYLILDWKHFVKTSEYKIFLNILCCLILYLIILFITYRPGISAIIAHVLIIAIGFADYFVYEFRGNELSFADLQSVGTGLSVASKYNFSINYRCIIVLIVSAAFIWACSRIKVKYTRKLQLKGITFLLVSLSAIIVTLGADNVNAETWEKKGSYQNGFILNFVLEVRDSFVAQPEQYSVEAVEELEQQYPEKSDAYSRAQVDHPTIIVIMNESFCDLKKVGDFQTNTPVTPFLDSLKENTTRGYALSSVYGAKTPNSEWEYLTGNSMAFVPNGAVVYQQYISDNPSSLIRTLKQEDYTCVAMHPYYETGWSRNTVYPNMGFDEMHFIEDFDQDKLIREYISDQEMYDKLIQRFENKKEDERLCIFGITMQNHGGYVKKYDNFSGKVHKMGTSYSDANQYLSLINESDKALQNLISYFKTVEEPVEIVFFGDHQPGLYSKFYKLLNGKGVSGLTLTQLENLYTVPFFIWTNYDTEEKEIEISSLNYLSTMTLQKANIDLPAYNQFLAEMMEEVPALNASGYYSKQAGGYRHIEDAKGDEAEWIHKYQILQYNSMFDEKNRSNKFFPY